MKILKFNLSVKLISFIIIFTFLWSNIIYASGGIPSAKSSFLSIDTQKSLYDAIKLADALETPLALHKIQKDLGFDSLRDQVIHRDRVMEIMRQLRKEEKLKIDIEDSENIYSLLLSEKDDRGKKRDGWRAYYYFNNKGYFVRIRNRETDDPFYTGFLKDWGNLVYEPLKINGEIVDVFESKNIKGVIDFCLEKLYGREIEAVDTRGRTDNAQDAEDYVLSFLKRQGFPRFELDNAEELSTKTNDLADRQVMGLLIHPETGKIIELDYWERVKDYVKRPFAVWPYKMVECTLYEKIDPDRGYNNLWVDNIIPIAGDEIYHKDGTPYTEEELERGGLGKIRNSKGEPVKLNALVGVGHRVISIPGPWIVPYISTEESGEIILKTIDDVRRLTDNTVNYDNLHETLMDLAERGKIKIRFASTIEFKGAGCIDFYSVDKMPEKVRALNGGNVCIHGLAIGEATGRNFIYDGVGVASIDHVRSMPVEEEIREAGAVILSDSIGAVEIFDNSKLAELDHLSADVIERYPWLAAPCQIFRLGHNSQVLQGWIAQEDAYNEGLIQTNIKILREYIQKVYGRNGVDAYIKQVFKNLARNMRVCLPRYIYRSRDSNVPHNWGAEFQWIDLSTRDFRKVVNPGTIGTVPQELMFAECWRNIWSYFNIIYTDLTNDTTSNILEHRYFQEIFLEELFRENAQWAREEFNRYVQEAMQEVRGLRTVPHFYVHDALMEMLREKGLLESEAVSSKGGTMGRWDYKHTTFDKDTGILKLHNATRIANRKGVIEEEFLICGENKPRDIELETVSIEEYCKEKAKLIEELKDELYLEPLEPIEIRVIVGLEAIKHRIYGVVSKNTIFLRDDILNKGDRNQISEALIHEVLHIETQKPHDEIRKKQYKGGLRELIRELSALDKKWYGDIKKNDRERFLDRQAEDFKQWIDQERFDRTKHFVGSAFNYLKQLYQRNPCFLRLGISWITFCRRTIVSLAEGQLDSALDLILQMYHLPLEEVIGNIDKEVADEFKNELQAIVTEYGEVYFSDLPHHVKRKFYGVMSRYYNLSIFDIYILNGTLIDDSIYIGLKDRIFEILVTDSSTQESKIFGLWLLRKYIYILKDLNGGITLAESILKFYPIILNGIDELVLDNLSAILSDLGFGDLDMLNDFLLKYLDNVLSKNSSDSLARENMGKILETRSKAKPKTLNDSLSEELKVANPNQSQLILKELWRLCEKVPNGRDALLSLAKAISDVGNNEWKEEVERKIDEVMIDKELEAAILDRAILLLSIENEELCWVRESRKKREKLIDMLKGMKEKGGLKRYILGLLLESLNDDNGNEPETPIQCRTTGITGIMDRGKRKLLMGGKDTVDSENYSPIDKEIRATKNYVINRLPRRLRRIYLSNIHHGKKHADDLIEKAKHLSRALGVEGIVDWSVLTCAIYLHDVFAYKDETHGKSAVQYIAKNYIGDSYFTGEQIEKIKDAILLHEDRTYPGQIDRKRAGIEAQLLYEVDQLDAFGIKGIYRYLAIYFKRGKDISDIKQDVLPNVRARYETLSFNESKRMGQADFRIIERFLMKLTKETYLKKYPYGATGVCYYIKRYHKYPPKVIAEKALKELNKRFTIVRGGEGADRGYAINFFTDLLKEYDNNEMDERKDKGDGKEGLTAKHQLQPGWTLANHRFMAFHIMFLSSVVFVLIGLAFSGIISIGILGGFFSTELFKAIVFYAFVGRHFVISTHQMAHYLEARKQGVLADDVVTKIEESGVERGVKDNIMLEIAELFRKYKDPNYNENDKPTLSQIISIGIKDTLIKLRWYLRMFLTIPYGKFPGVERRGSLFTPTLFVKLSGSNLSVDASAPILAKKVAAVTLFIGIPTYLAGLFLMGTAAALSGVLVSLARLCLVIGVISFLDITRTDNNAYNKYMRELRGIKTKIKGKPKAAATVPEVRRDTIKDILTRDDQTTVLAQNETEKLRSAHQFRIIVKGRSQGSNISFNGVGIVVLGLTKRKAEILIDAIQNKLQGAMQTTPGINHLGPSVTGSETGSFDYGAQNYSHIRGLGWIPNATYEGQEKYYLEEVKPGDSIAEKQAKEAFQFDEEEILKLLYKVIYESGAVPYGMQKETDEEKPMVLIGLDVGADQMAREFREKTKRDETGRYIFSARADDREVDSDTLIKLYQRYYERYGIGILINPLSGDDTKGYQKLMEVLGDKMFVASETIFKGNIDKIISSEMKPGRDIDTIMINPGQTGTISETIYAIKAARKRGYHVMLSRPLEASPDTFDTDLSLATGVEFENYGGARNVETLERVDHRDVEADLVYRKYKRGKPDRTVEDITIADIRAYDTLTNARVPTVQVRVLLSDGSEFTADSPVGTYATKEEAKKIDQAVFLIDGDKSQYRGRGVYETAVRNFNEHLAPLFIGKSIFELGDVIDIERVLLQKEKETAIQEGLLRPSANEEEQKRVLQRKQALGMNAIFPVSLALARVIAFREGKTLREIIKDVYHKEPDQDYLYGFGGRKSHLQGEWILANHNFMSFHIAFLSGIVAFLVKLMFQGMIPLDILLEIFIKDLFEAIVLAYIVGHTAMSIHEMGHYFEARRQGQLSKSTMKKIVESQVEEGVVDNIWKTMKTRIQKFRDPTYILDDKPKSMAQIMGLLLQDIKVKIRWYVEMFLHIPLGHFPGVERSGRFFTPGLYVSTETRGEDKLIIDAAGPRKSKLLTITAFMTTIPLTVLTLYVMVLNLTSAVTVGLLQIFSRLTLGIGIVSWLDIKRTDDNAYEKLKNKRKIDKLRIKRIRETAVMGEETPAADREDEIATIDGKPRRLNARTWILTRRDEAQRYLYITADGREEEIIVPEQQRNTIQGGVHTDVVDIDKDGNLQIIFQLGNLGLQEFMVTPISTKTGDDAMREISAAASAIQLEVVDILNEYPGLFNKGQALEGGQGVDLRYGTISFRDIPGFEWIEDKIYPEEKKEHMEDPKDDDPQKLKEEKLRFCLAEEEAIKILTLAIIRAGYVPGNLPETEENRDKVRVWIAIDGATSTLSDIYNKRRHGKDRRDWESGYYEHYKSPGTPVLTTDEMLNWFDRLEERGYPIWSIEDAFAEDDPPGWWEMYRRHRNDWTIVGDDNVTTNQISIRETKRTESQNATLIKYNQIGTLSETAEAIEAAYEDKLLYKAFVDEIDNLDRILKQLKSSTIIDQKEIETLKEEAIETMQLVLAKIYLKEQYDIVVSHRSQSPKDDGEAILAVGAKAMAMKCGGSLNMERQSKYHWVRVAVDWAVRKIIRGKPDKERYKAKGRDITITDIRAYEIRCNSGTPTVRVYIRLSNGHEFMGACPKGTSAGSGEATHIIDRKEHEFNNKGCQTAVGNVNEIIRKKFIGKSIWDLGNLIDIDRTLLQTELEAFTEEKLRQVIDAEIRSQQLQGTGKTPEEITREAIIRVKQEKKKIGMNAILPTSLAFCRLIGYRDGKPDWLVFRELMDEVKNARTDLDRERAEIREDLANKLKIGLGKIVGNQLGDLSEIILSFNNIRERIVNYWERENFDACSNYLYGFIDSIKSEELSAVGEKQEERKRGPIGKLTQGPYAELAQATISIADDGELIIGDISPIERSDQNPYGVGMNHPKYGNIDIGLLTEIFKKLISVYGFGIIANTDAVRFVDNIQAPPKLQAVTGQASLPEAASSYGAGKSQVPSGTVPYAMMVKEGKSNVLLLDIDAFPKSEWKGKTGFNDEEVDKWINEAKLRERKNRKAQETILFIVMEHELKESIMTIVPCENDAVRELTTNYMTLQLVLRYIEEGKLTVEDLEQNLKKLGADLQFLEAVETLVNEGVRPEESEKIIATAIEYMRTMPYYAELFKQFRFAEIWENSISKVSDTEERYKAALKVFNDIMEARIEADEAIKNRMQRELEKTISEVNINIRVVETFTGGKRIVGLEDLSKMLKAVIGALAKAIWSRGYMESTLRESINKPDANLKEQYWIILDRETKEQFERMVGKDVLEEQIRVLEGMESGGRQLFKIVYDINEVPHEAFSGQNPRVIHLYNLMDINNVEKRTNIMYLPMFYTSSSLYLAAHILLAGGNVNEIEDKLVSNIIINFYTALLGKEAKDIDWNMLFRRPWEIVRVTENLNILPEAIARIEKEA